MTLGRGLYLADSICCLLVFACVWFTLVGLRLFVCVCGGVVVVSLLTFLMFVCL